MCSLLQWQRIVNKLFIKYYGININDTAFCDIKYAKRYWSDGVLPYQAVNEWVYKYDLRRLDLAMGLLNENNESEIKNQLKTN